MKKLLTVAVVALMTMIGVNTHLASEPVPVDQFVNFETAHVHPLELTPDGNTLLAVNTAANTLEVFAIAVDGSLTNVNSIPVGHDPVSVRARSNTEVWVANQISDSISIVDLSIGAVIRTLQTENEPSDIVFAGSPLRAFVTCAERESIQVFNLSNLGANPTEVLLIGEQPRALAVSPDGSTVYAAFFESGNETTVVPGNDFIAGGGLLAPFSGTTIVANDVRNPSGPYSGAVPVPNDGQDFDPPLNPALPPKTDTQSLVVKKQPDGTWRDDNDGDWTTLVSGGAGIRTNGWDLKDRDVAVLDANTLALSYQDHLGNILMAMSVNPVNEDVYVVGTDSLNHIRFEPNLTGIFMRHNLSRFTTGNDAVTITDLNPHLDYSSPSVTNPVKALSVGDPRAVEWTADGSVAYVSGLGSNNVVMIDDAGDRVGNPIVVGEGPTGIAINDSLGKVFVLNKFSASISVVDRVTDSVESETFFFDPTPQVVKTGRPHLYNTFTGSGNGTISCASCHVDGKWDRLGWDLGNPAGEMETVNGIEFHPLKGLKTTQTLMDILSSGFPLHWRGDKASFRDFHLAFENLKGREPLSEAAMIEFEEFLATTYHPPNPYRPATNNNNLLNGFIRGPGTSFQTPNLSFQGSNAIGAWHTACGGCHQNNSGKGPPGAQNFRNSQYEGSEMIAPDLRLFYRKLGFYHNSDDSTVGFGLFSDGIGRTTETPRTGYWFDYHGILFGYSGGGPFNPLITPHNAQSSHYQTGRQATRSGSIGSNTEVNNLRNVANNSSDFGGLTQMQVGMIVKGIYQGEQRGFVYTGGNQYLSDRDETVTHATLLAAAAADNNEPLTWTLVHDHVANRLGIDRNGNGVVDDLDIADADSDGVPDENDAFPNDPTESLDSDNDGIGNNADTDDDNDGVPDETDQLPFDPDESLDSDADGIGDNADTDDDGDGVPDDEDAFPLDFNESNDSDGDGIGDNADTDDDNDGIVTISEAGGADFSTLSEQMNAGALGQAETTLIDLTTQGAIIGQNVALSGIMAMGDLNGANEGISIDVNNGEFVSAVFRTGTNVCGTLVDVFPAVNAVVTVIDIGNGTPGLSIVATGTATTDDRCPDDDGTPGPQLAIQLDGTASFVADFDNDGVPNDVDLDSDNDSIADLVEAGLVDSNGDYLVDDASQQGSVSDLPDTDNDGIPDLFDRESSNPLNDGTAFDIAATAFAAFDTNNDGAVDAADTDGGVDDNSNGVDDRFESSDPITPPDPVDPIDPTPVDGISNGGVTIAVDGNVGDWAAVTAFAADPDDISGPNNTLDLAQAWFAHDSNNLYIRYDSHAPDAMVNSWGYSVQMDTDGDINTGFRGFGGELPIGVDYMIEGSTLHRYTGTGTDFSWAAGVLLPNAVQGNSLELSLSLAEIGNPAQVHAFLFGNSVAVNGTAQDYYPDAASDNSQPASNRYFAYAIGDVPDPEPPVVTPPSDGVFNPATIVADGDLADWAATTSFGTDPDDVSGANNVLDWQEAWIAHDDSNLYFGWQNYDAAQLSWGNGIMIDADRDAATGFRGFSSELPVGVDYLLEADTVHQYTGSGTDWSWTTAGNIAPAISGTAVEISLARNVIGNPTSFDVFYVANSTATGGDAQDFYPDAASDPSSPASNRYFTYSTVAIDTPVDPVDPVDQRTITLDGSLSDWTDADLIGGEDANEMTPPDTIDWRSLRVAANNNTIYFAYESFDPVQLSWGYGLMIDTDGDTGTGFRGFGNELAIGADYIMEANELNRYTGSTQNEWSWVSEGTQQIVMSGSVAEIAIPRTTLNNPSALQLLLKGENSAVGGTGVDLHPDNGVLNFTVPTLQLDEPELAAANASTSSSGGGSAGWLSVLGLLWILFLRTVARLSTVRRHLLQRRLPLLAVMALGLAACDSGGGNGSGTNGSTSQPNNNPSFVIVDTDQAPRANASFTSSMRVSLSGAEMVPAIDSTGTGEARLILNTQTGELTGTVTHSLGDATLATIGVAATGTNGIPIVMLGRRTDNQFAVPTGTSLTSGQIAAFRGETLYVTVHSQMYPNGELRGQVTRSALED